MADSEGRTQWKTVSGDEMRVGDLTITPQSQALTVRWPNGGLVWNRPVAVLVDRDGQKERIPIVDVTMSAQLALYGLAAAITLGALLLSIRGRRKRNE